jgi:hypothetical protein
MRPGSADPRHSKNDEPFFTIATQGIYAFPIVESIHVLGLCLFLGACRMIAYNWFDKH